MRIPSAAAYCFQYRYITWDYSVMGHYLYRKNTVSRIATNRTLTEESNNGTTSKFSYVSVEYPLEFEEALSGTNKD